MRLVYVTSKPAKRFIILPEFWVPDPSMRPSRYEDLRDAYQDPLPKAKLSQFSRR